MGPVRDGEKKKKKNVPVVDDLQFDTPLDHIQVQPEEVDKLLQGLNVTKSMGPDNMHPFMLKSLGKTVSKPVTLIFQKSLNEGRVPCDWKCAKITPLFKKGKKSVVNNYRPVSLTSILCKCLEKIIRSRMMEHLDKYNILSEHQFGFRSGRSCALQLLDVLEDWSVFVDSEKSWDTVYLDLAKAFDKVSHQRLLRKVSAAGIKGNVLSWIGDFLSNRKQCVQVKGHVSDWKDVLSGVPQGSVLGPILFLLYVNDLPDIINSKIKTFADDTKVYETTENCNSLQHDLNKICAWANKWELTFNVDKCKVMHYGKSNGNFEYSMNSKKLCEVSEESDLGVTFQDDLKFNKHVSFKVQKANSILGLISRSFEYISRESYVQLYKALVRPHLEYGNAVWHPYLRKEIEMLENVQRRFSRLVPGLRDLQYSDRLKCLNLPSLAHRRKRGDIIQCFKIVKGLEDIPCERFYRIVQTRTRGHCYKLDKPRSQTNFRLRSFSQRTISDWNKLPSHVVAAKTVNSFKNRIDKLWDDEKQYQY